MAKIKVQITVDEQLLNRIDSYADDHYTSRSGAFALGAENLLMQDELRQAIGRIADAFQRIAMTGNMSDEDRQQLAAFQLLASSMAGKV